MSPSSLSSTPRGTKGLSSRDPGWPRGIEGIVGCWWRLVDRSARTLFSNYGRSRQSRRSCECLRQPWPCCRTSRFKLTNRTASGPRAPGNLDPAAARSVRGGNSALVNINILLSCSRSQQREGHRERRLFLPGGAIGSSKVPSSILSTAAQAEGVRLLPRGRITASSGARTCSAVASASMQHSQACSNL